MLPSLQKKKKTPRAAAETTTTTTTKTKTTKKKPSFNLKKSSNNNNTSPMIIILYFLLIASILSFVATYISFSSTQNNNNNNNKNTPILLSSDVVVLKKQQQQSDNNNNNGTTTANQSEETLQSSLPPPRPHPHAGARYPDGITWGYVADVTLARRLFIKQYQQKQQQQQKNNVNSTTTTKAINSKAKKMHNIHNYMPFKSTEEMDKVCNTPPTQGRERSSGWKLLTQKVKVIQQHQQQKQGTKKKSSTTTTTTRPKVLCVVYTYEKRHYIVQSIVETWGWRCDGFFAASTKTIITYNNNNNNNDNTTTTTTNENEEGSNSSNAYIIDLPHEGPEHYDNMWMKTRSIWAYIHDHYLYDFDFFYLSGDDTHVIVENLIHFLQQSYYNITDNIEKYPLYLGHWIPTKDWKTTSNYYCGGGPGYVLNRRSVSILISDVLPNCGTNKVTSAEDRVLGNCFQSIKGIVGNNTVDEYGSQRFHGMDPQFVSTFKGAKGYYKGVYEYWAQQFGGYKYGMNLTSSESISFHLLKYPIWMKRHHAILYKSCPPCTALGDALLEF